MIQLSARAGLQYAVVVAFLWAGAIAPAQTFTTLKSFGILTNVSGFNPTSQLVQGPDGTPYGTTTQGEGHVGGTVFKVRPDGSGFTALKWFTNSLEGDNHQAGLILSGSTLFGTTREGDSLGLGSVFKLNTAGTDFMVLKHFNGSDGEHPATSLALSGQDRQPNVQKHSTTERRHDGIGIPPAIRHFAVANKTKNKTKDRTYEDN